MVKCSDYFDDHLGKWIAMIHLTDTEVLDRELHPFGLSRATYGLFFHLYCEDGIRQDEWGREIQVNKSTVARAAQKLEKLGYVVRKPDQNDRRVYRIFLTPKALKIREEVMGILWKRSKAMLRGISKKKQVELFDLLKLVYKNIADDYDKFHKEAK